MNSLMTRLQQLGKALMGAVAVMPVAAILMGIGYYLSSTLGEDNLFSGILLTAGGVVLGNLGVIFAVAIAYGLAKESHGAAALAGLLSFSTLTLLLSPKAVASYRGIADPTALSGDEALRWAAQGWNAVGNNNVFFGIIAGLLAAWAYNTFHAKRLPDFLAFFSGRRLVPIVSAVFAIVAAGVMYVVWPLLYRILFGFGQWIESLGWIGAGIYGFANRLLIPTGLHHALNQIFWFDVVGINDIGKFLGGQDTIAAAAAATDAASCPGTWDAATQACQVLGVVGQYQAGFFPVMMFGLPGAALAIVLRAQPQRRAVTASLMSAGALASFFTGVTEPLEFSFMFAAPLLYLVHAVFMGISVALASAMGWTAGFGFSAGLVDMLLSASNPLANQWWMLLVQGIVFFALYFGVFYVLIGVRDLATPGRGEEEPAAPAEGASSAAAGGDRFAVMAHAMLQGLGGAENVSSLTHCATRLRVVTRDPEKVDEAAIQAAGAMGVVRPSDSAVQVIVGPTVQFVHDEMQQICAAQPSADQPGAAGASITLRAPLVGQVIPLQEVSDPAFAGGQLGPGFAVEPDATLERVEVLAPADGTLRAVFPTGHAFILRLDAGIDALVHIGFDTVELKGEGFERLARKGERVSAGTPIVRVNADLVRRAGKDLTTAVVFPEATDIREVRVGEKQATVVRESNTARATQ